EPCSNPRCGAQRLKSNGIELDDWLTTESVRRREQRVGRWPDDEAAILIARESADSFEGRLVQRARALPGRGSVAQDLKVLKRWARRFLVALCLLGLASGWLAARASAADREMDLLLVTLTLIGLPTVFLLLWFLVWMFSFRRTRSRGPLSGIAARGLDWLGPRVFRSEMAVELAQSAAAALPTSAGRWWLSLGTHLLWLFFSIGAAIALVLYFSLAQYDLSWGTTILDEQTVVQLVQGLAWLPRELGLIPPLSNEFIERGRVGGLAGIDRAQWARFLMLMVLVYIALPRLMLAALSWLRLRSVRRRLPLALGQPAYLRLESDLMNHGESERLLDKPPELWPERALRSRPATSGRAVLIDLELEPESQGAMATALADRVVYLGLADGRAQRAALEEALQAMSPPPGELLVVCSLRRTPDRGAARLLGRLADAARSGVVLVMIDLDSVQRRGGSARARIEDWERLARHVGARVQVIERDAAGALLTEPLVAELGSSE
ncbi:MAG: DUF2868 domain-containing protein, partial [Pseudomonadota bacterium]